MIDLTGKKFGRLTVISRTENRGKRLFWDCICDCGNKVAKAGDSLKNGETKSCGCLKREQQQINLREKYTGKVAQDLANKRFGRLVALYEIPDQPPGKRKWYCRCDCGSEVEARANLLLTNSTRSCGCLKREQDSINIKEKYEEKKVDGVSVPALSAKLRKDNKSGVKGVYWSESRQKWFAELMVKSERVLCAGFVTKEEAIEARMEAEEKYHQPFIEARNPRD